MILIFRTERSDFKREPCKVCSLDGWSAALLDNPQQMNTFQLINTSLGTVYKFRTGSAQASAQWLDALRQDAVLVAARQQQQQENNGEHSLPVNLMTFE